MTLAALKSGIISSRAPGDFTGLAEDYGKYRPGYSVDVLRAIVSLLAQPAAQCDAADLGAGTGIFTRQLAEFGFRSLTAVEPNADMRSVGGEQSSSMGIEWRDGRGEATGLAPESVDLVTMASSFHWVDFQSGIAEFHRILRRSGCFVALWNPRLIETNPLLVEIEAKAKSLASDAARVSSGLSGRAELMTSLFSGYKLFDMPTYIEGRHTLRMSPEAYLGVWRSVNDWRVKLGPARFGQFMDFVSHRIEGLEAIETTYLTRAWVARKI